MMKTMTDKATEANRMNARHSTGPRTAEGKAAVGKNGLKHGLIAQGVLPSEDPADLRRMKDALRVELRPVGLLETELVDRAAGMLFRLRRCERAETGWLASRQLSRLVHAVHVPDDHVPFEMPTFLGTPKPPSRERAELQMAARAELSELEAVKEEPLPQFATLFMGADFTPIARHEGHLQRMLCSTLHELERLQLRRMGEPVPAPAALDVMVSNGFEL